MTEPRRAADGEYGVYASLADLTALRPRAAGFSFLPRQPVRSVLAGRRASRLRGRGLDFDEIRPYVPGDDPRTIDWKVSARMRSLHSRVFDEERERPVLLVVDQRMNMFFGSRTKLKSVAAAEAAAVAAWRTLSVKDRVGGVVFGDAGLDVVRPHRSEAAVMELLGRLVERNRNLNAAAPPPDPERLNEALSRAASLATHDYLVAVVTDGFGIDERTRRLATEIARRNDVVAAFVYDPLEVDFVHRGQATASDGRLRIELPRSGGDLRRRFREDYEARLAQLRRFLLTRHTPLIALDASMDAADQVARQLGALPRRGR